MPVSAYDRANIKSILDGEGDWYTSHVLRFLDKVLFKADNENFRVLWEAFPKESLLIYSFYGWTDERIAERLSNAHYNV